MPTSALTSKTSNPPQQPLMKIPLREPPNLAKNLFTNHRNPQQARRVNLDRRYTSSVAVLCRQWPDSRLTGENLATASLGVFVRAGVSAAETIPLHPPPICPERLTVSR